MNSATDASAIGTAPIHDDGDGMWIVIGTTGALIVAGLVADVVLRSCGPDRKRHWLPPVWVLCMLLGSYACLIPGLALNLFSSRASLHLIGPPAPLVDLSESMLGLIRHMAQHRVYAGAVLVTLYAIIIPVLKLGLLALGLFFQVGPRPQLRRARRCILIVRSLSKWASPDMFAYILMAHLFRSMDRPPKLSSDADLGVGFVCFCVFCALSTVASLGLRVPDAGDGNASDVKPSTDDLPAASATQVEGHAVRPAPARVVLFGVLLAAVFLAMLAVGAVMPCMTLHMDMDRLYIARPALKPFSRFIDAQNLPALLNSEVSLVSCLVGLAGWIAEGSAHAAVALAMLGVFAIVLPMVDVAALLVAAVSTDSRGMALRLSGVVGKLSMLEVSMVGVVVIVFGLWNLRIRGVVVAIGPGFWPLVVAEVCHCALALLLRRAEARPHRCKDDISTASEVSSEGSPDAIASQSSMTSVSGESSQRPFCPGEEVGQVAAP
mmetsp:Transcript_74232/g.215072  ORF Transcript_74232/g.215072 Transcript_74232/m.215072 type:complete len:492 (-) Transcript_74232:89-1564(-)|eukprot:CAMPEP_0176047384 /NCGR_PEP_ID=MMETSP0120_2-20121206/23533_1 /TAXON_ID=160619 /ORGANISM="Kryptoperidinium foliaceum, Strain CCMP 1326" /LENGTH=491 /DNA_ID=CAMNT_0017380799 /DNA_START=69 /DNA_END=1544 /DNA_ORIENTATION=+